MRDASLPPSQLVTRYLSGMFSESVTQEVREELANIMSDFHPTGFRLMAATSAQVDTRDLLPNIRVPTLLIWGDADKRSSMSVACQIRDAIPGARLVVISGAGHVSNLENSLSSIRSYAISVCTFCLYETQSTTGPK
jgi:pimeloyl-ACP methyl ester carboxylesterase